MNHWALSQSIANSFTTSNKQGSIQSISSETTDYGRSVWRVESRSVKSLVLSKRLRKPHQYSTLVDLQSGWWVAHTHFPRWTSPSPLEWRRKKWQIDSLLTVYPKDRRDTRSEIPELRHSNWNGRWWGWDRWRGWRRDGTEWHGEGWVGRVSTMIHEIEQ